MSYERGAGKGRILVVDDEELNRILLSTSLGESGYTVETAEDGRQALRMLHAQPFDVVLLDLIMPRMDGFEVLAEMKRDAAQPGAAVCADQGIPGQPARGTDGHPT
jgi:CheY-like chemotaxis protein